MAGKAPLPNDLMDRTAIGQVMVANGFMTDDQVKWAAAYQQEFRNDWQRQHPGEKIPREQDLQIGQIFKGMTDGSLDPKFNPEGKANPGTVQPIKEADIQQGLDVQKLVRGELAAKIREMGKDPENMTTAEAQALFSSQDIQERLKTTWKAEDDRHRRVEDGQEGVHPTTEPPTRVEPGKDAEPPHLFITPLQVEPGKSGSLDQLRGGIVPDVTAGDGRPDPIANLVDAIARSKAENDLKHDPTAEKRAGERGEGQQHK